MDIRKQCQDGVSILCVEDDGATREFLCRLVALKYPHCRLFSAKNGHTGLEIFHAHGAGIVLTDLNMPVMDGIQMARAIRGMRQGVYIVALTAYDISLCLAGEERHTLFDHYLLKPLDRKHLCDVMDRCIYASARPAGTRHTASPALPQEIDQVPSLPDGDAFPE